MILIKDLTISEFATECAKHKGSCSGCAFHLNIDYGSCPVNSLPYRWRLNVPCEIEPEPKPEFKSDDIRTWKARDVKAYCEKQLCANCRFRADTNDGNACKFSNPFPEDYTAIEMKPELIVTADLYWHRYPQSLPTESGRKLVSLSNGTVREAYWLKDKPTFIVGGNEIENLIISIDAWAEMPENYKTAIDKEAKR